MTEPWHTRLSPHTFAVAVQLTVPCLSPSSSHTTLAPSPEPCCSRATRCAPPPVGPFLLCATIPASYFSHSAEASRRPRRCIGVRGGRSRPRGERLHLLPPRWELNDNEASGCAMERGWWAARYLHPTPSLCHQQGRLPYHRRWAETGVEREAVEEQSQGYFHLRKYSSKHARFESGNLIKPFCGVAFLRNPFLRVA